MKVKDTTNTANLNLIYYIAFFVSSTVPSRPPSNLNIRFICDRYELEISWLPLTNNYTNGILRSYKVLVYQGETFYKNASVTSEKATSLVSLDECRNYSVVLAAVTTPGTGPNITTNVVSSCPCGKC